MTNSNNNSNDRLARIEAIVESNARTIQAILDNRETERLEHEERMAKMSEAILQLVTVEQGLANMLVGLDENQPTILRRLMSIENKVDRILDRDES